MIRIRVTYILSILFLLPLLSFSDCAKAQDEVHYLDAQLNDTKKRKAVYRREMEKVSDDLYTSTVYDASDRVKFIGSYKKAQNKLFEHGEFVFYHPSGQIESRGRYEFGVKVGSWERYTASGGRKPDRYYDPEGAAVIRDVMGG